MASLVACALTEDPPPSGDKDPRHGIDRVLRGTFWRPDRDARVAPVIPIASRRSRRGTTPSNG